MAYVAAWLSWVGRKQTWSRRQQQRTYASRAEAGQGRALDRSPALNLFFPVSQPLCGGWWLFVEGSGRGARGRVGAAGSTRLWSVFGEISTASLSFRPG